jgi:hypothetical protein
MGAHAALACLVLLLGMCGFRFGCANAATLDAATLDAATLDAATLDAATLDADPRRAPSACTLQTMALMLAANVGHAVLPLCVAFREPSRPSSSSERSSLTGEAALQEAEDAVTASTTTRIADRLTTTRFWNSVLAVWCLTWLVVLVVRVHEDAKIFRGHDGDVCVGQRSSPTGDDSNSGAPCSVSFAVARRVASLAGFGFLAAESLRLFGVATIAFVSVLFRH